MSFPALRACSFVLKSAARSRRIRIAFSSVALLAYTAKLSWSENSAARPSASPVASLAEALQHAANTELHIFYVHGIGANGPDHDSQQLRTSICSFWHCTTKYGEYAGTDYADEDYFALNVPPPDLTYLGKRIWNPREGPSQEWNASAPYVDHWKLTSVKNPKAFFYVDEINWWPLVFGLKCREIVAGDAKLTGPNKKYIDLCSRSKPAGPENPGRFIYYPWLSSDEVHGLNLLRARGALINRTFKQNLLDWGFSDALLAVGTIQPLLLEGIREVIRKSVTPPRGSSLGLLPPDREFVIVTHSLGSYLIFSALDFKNPDKPEKQEWKSQFDDVLRHTTIVYFFANQLRLLELANLDASPTGNIVEHLERWASLRNGYVASATPLPAKGASAAKIVAWSDPSDLLTWRVPKLGEQIAVENHFIRNAIDWFGLFEAPQSAHDNYASKQKVIRAIPLNAEEQEPNQ